jgi:hypothetical protein
MDDVGAAQGNKNPRGLLFGERRYVLKMNPTITVVSSKRETAGV